MKRIAVVLICWLILASPAWASLKISVDGEVVGDYVWLNPVHEYSLGIVGDGETPSPVACYLLLLQNWCPHSTKDFSGGKMLYQGTLSEYVDLEEIAIRVGMKPYEVLAFFYSYGYRARDLAFITLADGSIPPKPLNGVLVDDITYLGCLWDEVILIDNDLDNPVIYDKVMFIPEPGTAVLLSVGWLGFLRKRRREHS